MSSAEPQFYPTNDIVPEAPQGEMSDWGRPDEYTETLISTSTALEIGLREAGTGRFIRSPQGNFGTPGYFADTSGYRPDTPRATIEISDCLLTEPYNSNGGYPPSVPATDAIPGLTGSDSTITPTNPITVFTYSQCTDSGTEIPEGDYTTSERYEFLEYPVPCLFGFGGICSIRFATSVDRGDWTSHVESHLPGGETPNIYAKCLYEGCSDHSYHDWQGLLSHVFAHFTSNSEPTNMLEINPDVSLLDYCRRHKIISKDTYLAYKMQAVQY